MLFTVCFPGGTNSFLYEKTSIGRAFTSREVNKKSELVTLGKTGRKNGGVHYSS